MTVDERIKMLSELSWPELRTAAQKEYGISLSSRHTKDWILAEIKKKLTDQNYVPSVFGDGAPFPGYCRIKLAKANGKSRPKIKNINGYRCAIPRDVVVDVPYKVYQSILDEFELVREEDLSEPEDSASRFKDVRAPAEMVSLIAYTPGPDPRPVWEAVKERKNQKYIEFVNAFGYWPTDIELKQAIQSGQLKTQNPDALAHARQQSA